MTSTNSVRVGLLGAPCSGKTTLALAAQNQMGAHILSEAATAWLRSNSLEKWKEDVGVQREITMQQRRREMKFLDEGHDVPLVSDSPSFLGIAYWAWHPMVSSQAREKLLESEEVLELVAWTRGYYDELIFLPLVEAYYEQAGIRPPLEEALEWERRIFRLCVRWGLELHVPAGDAREQFLRSRLGMTC